MAGSGRRKKKKVLTLIRQKKHRDGSVSLVSKERLPRGTSVQKAVSHLTLELGKTPGHISIRSARGDDGQRSTRRLDGLSNEHSKTISFSANEGSRSFKAPEEEKK